MQLDDARTLLDYHLGSNARLWECVMALTDEQFVQPCSYSLGSVRNQMVHLASVDARWLARLQAVEPPLHLNPEDFPTRESARVKHDEIAAQLRAYADGLTEDALSHSFTYDIRGARNNTAWQIIAHTVNHGTDHRAQILRLLHDLGAPTFEQDMIIYLWNK